MPLYASGLLDSTSFSLPQWPGIATFSLSERHAESGFNVKSMYNQILGSGLSFNLPDYPDLPPGSGIEYLVTSLRRNIFLSLFKASDESNSPLLRLCSNSIVA